MADELWRYLQDIPCWTPLKSVRLSASCVGESLYRCSPSAFLIAQPYRANLVPDREAGPFLTMFAWAVSEGAAKRVYLRQKEEDELRRGQPPEEMLPPGCEATYRALLGATRAAGADSSETASYRIASDGAFLYRSIHAGRWNYYFRGRRDRATESPFVIECRLR
jgi:hypothetical protein